MKKIFLLTLIITFSAISAVFAFSPFPDAKESMTTQLGTSKDKMEDQLGKSSERLSDSNLSSSNERAKDMLGPADDTGVGKTYGGK